MAEWHPLLSAREVTPGHWIMVDGLGDPYGTIRLVKRGTEVGYRADRCDGSENVIEHVGYFRTLRGATAQTHQRFIRAHGAPESREHGR